ncbi:hypothetical protein HK104_000236 [Borealophlyctis nickersoniae]|nr:hypothetical protein HK104_000236 [Borealophlyctis nickersoniae]
MPPERQRQGKSRNCRCDELGRKCPSCKNYTYRQRLVQRRLVEREQNLPVRLAIDSAPLPQTAETLPRFRAILPAPPHNKLDRSKLILEQAVSLFTASGRGLDPREFRAGRCISGKGAKKCGKLANVTRPRCALHTAIEEGIEVKHSGMGVGLGAFASGMYLHRKGDSPIVFNKGDVVCEYRGYVMNEEQFCRRYPPHQRAEYAFQISTDPFIVIDARDSTAGVSRYINEPPKGRAANAQYEKHPDFPKVKRVVCRAKRDILVGEEILAKYGTSKDYYSGTGKV